jgi:hypothetical protein
MRFLNFGVIIAFLLASTHMVVDHGGGPRDFVFIPHVNTLPFHVDDHDRESSGSHAPAQHDADTHTHFEWCTIAAGSDVPFQPLVSVIGDSYAWLTEQPFVAPPRFHITAFTHPPPHTSLYLRCCAFLA